MSEDDERPSERSGGADASWSDAEHSDQSWAHAAAPDDISELARDIHAYHREQRSARRQQRYGRFALGPTSAPLTLTVAALAVVAVVATLLTVMVPRSAGSPRPLPLRTTSIADGKVGGLLPDVSLVNAAHQTVAARALRPAVFAVVPIGCGCTDDVRTAAQQASTRNIPLYAVFPAGPSAQADGLNGQLRPEAILTDPTGDMIAAVGPSALTLVLINRDGSIYQVSRGADAQDTAALPANLDMMLGTHA